MHIAENTPLLPYNTFGIAASAHRFVEVRQRHELQALHRLGERPALVIGGGSNLLLTGDVAGLTLKNSIQGITVVREFAHKVWVCVGGGENWHGFVTWAVAHGYGGVENLSLIPGTVGAAPIQNIGAYGVELKDVFLRLEAFDWESGKTRSFNRPDCRFGYRDSIFKREAKGRYTITQVYFSLQKRPHKVNLAYGDIRKTLEASGVAQPTIADVSSAVIAIRNSKLPNPAVIGNCGSFFKNPEVPRSVWEQIRVTHPAVPAFDLPDGRVKIPAGWLIEQCGWKGKRVGNTGCYEKQALVLVNHGNATGAEVRQLAYDIIASVQQQFAIALEPEVNII